MADHQFSLCLITAMDHLWFHSIILFSEPTLKPTSESLSCPSSNLSFISSDLDEVEEIISSSPLEDEEKSSDSSPISTSPDDSSIEDEEKGMNLKERSKRLNLFRSRSRSQSSSSPSSQKCPRTLRHAKSKLQKSMSCRSLMDLELEEVKGFMDLGFKFKKEHLCPRMMSVLPGLQRVQLCKNRELTRKVAKDDDDEIEQEEYDKGKIRPYLSEAWLIKRPDSPLLNLRMPRVTASADMKKHIRFWAKTVASAVQQECKQQVHAR